MLNTFISAIRRANKRAERRHAYHVLRRQSDAMLRDIGLERGGLYHAVMHGRDAA